MKRLREVAIGRERSPCGYFCAAVTTIGPMIKAIEKGQAKEPVPECFSCTEWDNNQLLYCKAMY